MAVDSITRTLEADVPKVERLKILIHGQEVETLAGHLDLTGTFVVDKMAVQGAPIRSASKSTSAEKPAPVTDKPAQPPRTGATR